MSHYNLIIQGAGPVGRIAALLGKKLGLDVILIEKNKLDDYRSDAHYLNAYTLEILDWCGINIQHLLKHASPQEYSFSIAYGTRMDRLYFHKNLLDCDIIKKQYDNIGKFGAAKNIPLHYAMKELKDALLKQKIPIMEMSQIELIESNFCMVRDNARLERITFDYLISSDGANSFIRKKIFPNTSKNNIMTFCNVAIKSNLSRIIEKPAQLNWVLNAKHPACVVMHEINGKQNIQIPLLNKDDINHFKFEQTIHDYCQSTLSDKDVELEIQDWNIWKLSTHIVSKARYRNIFFLGDSAHAFTPAGGLGLNTGIHETAELIWKIREKMRYNYSIDIMSREKINKKLLDKSIKNYEDFRRVSKLVWLHYDLIESNKLLYKIYNHTKESKLFDIANMAYSSLFPKIFDTNFFQKKFLRKIKHTLNHFNGLDEHLGVCQEDLTMDISNIIDSEKTTDIQFKFPPKAGCIWFDSNIFNNNNELFYYGFEYGKWHVFSFIVEPNTKKIEFRGDVNAYRLNVDFFCKHPINKDVIIIRPDRIVEAAVSIDALKTEYHFLLKSL